MGAFRFLLLSYSLFSLTTANFAIDNELTGEPEVDCEEGMVSLTFKTKKPFTGRVYVQGQAEDEKCSRNFARNADQSTVSVMVQNGDCTMSRQRVSGSIEGMMVSLTIVVSFHGTFVTKADRAYRCMCFFKSVKRLSNVIDIDSVPTTELMNTVPSPECEYSIRSGSPDGPPMSLGHVGDRIFHVWSCNSPNHNFLVHSCTVDDGRGLRFDLLDIDGCAIDPIIQPDVVYDNNGKRASVETFGYKFSDTAVLNYQCVIELCKISSGECRGLTPPACGRVKKRHVFKRETDSKLSVLQSLTMTNGADDIVPASITTSANENSVELVEPGKDGRSNCLESLLFAFVLTILAAISFAMGVIIIMFRRRNDSTELTF
ncbi:unnamed protein product [Bursaphelenchus okinawaensis]|uniref:ZP domain-containing protein n=1 Tax=Bursaphelenchus okinawaensis TaxID=465554 RepID=A0A811LPB4_9BILA|nr:unnamed protein product [Bursaphelenchus okinawaensis]CAG9125289.1 unnamed protein product [Bursaphelenchus okinawaensis]